jgi:CelD/BcsL family acetyltransferase involved in cellulose biosynthesis
VTAAALTPLPLTVGPRTLWTVKRRLVRSPLGLAETLAGQLPELPPLAPHEHGYLVTSLPAALEPALAAAHPRLRPFVRQRYRRAFTALDQAFETFLAGFSSKSRSTLKRKLRRFAERSGGAIDLRCYRRPEEMAAFHLHARAVSSVTYQERLLGAGLPEDSLGGMRERAARDAVRGWILFLDGRPVSYLHAPAEGDTLVYAHLGYDPEVADLSPGTVLLAEALRALMEERRFRLFDFTEGEGAHKLRFATGTIDCLDLLLLRPTIGNRAAIGLIGGFDGAVAGAKQTAARLGLESLARRLLR